VSKKLPVRFFLAAGTMEASFAINLLYENRRFRDVLEAKGYAVTYSECTSDHSLLNWRGSFADGVIALFGR
jgi:enterochelin esterase family protein